ncbi:MAG: hypothetical protein IPI73_05560 [Betaproteobacteria bacterium]|nr:hypothetical protein [Betaproteobacteria bacterium]
MLAGFAVIVGAAQGESTPRRAGASRGNRLSDSGDLYAGSGFANENSNQISSTKGHAITVHIRFQNYSLSFGPNNESPAVDELRMAN